MGTSGQTQTRRGKFGWGASRATSVHKQVEALWREGTAVGLTDGQLLERFVDRRHATPEAAEAAFAAIVDRHGAMVLRTCRRILGDEHEAQDAAQVTFLVLRAAPDDRRAPVGRRMAPWGRDPGGKQGEGRRDPAAIARELLRRSSPPDGESGVDDPERWAELHEELGRLPEHYRAPLVLCYLEGLTQEQAAAQLGWPLGTVQSRLARGRDKLKSRLIRRGVAPAATLAGTGVASGLSHAAPAPAHWIEATIRNAIAFTTRRSWAVKAGASPASAGLALEVLREMGFTKLKIAVAATLVIAVALTSAAALSRPEPKDPPAQYASPAPGQTDTGEETGDAACSGQSDHPRAGP